MENLIIFAVTLVLYSALSLLLFRPKDPKSLLKRVLFFAVLCIPFNIDGDIYTVIGNGISPTGSIYSLSSVYQSAKKDAVIITGVPIYQNAGRNVIMLFGLSGYQNAGKGAVTFFGLSGYQKADSMALTYIGFAFYQRVGENSRSFGTLSKFRRH